MSELLNSIVQEVGLTKIPTEEECNAMTDEEKNNLYEKQLQIISKFRDRSTQQIVNLQQELTIEMEVRKNIANQQLSPIFSSSNEDFDEEKATPKPAPKSKASTLTKSISSDVFINLNSKKPRKSYAAPPAQIPKPRKRFTNLDERPRFKN